jgi:hypothetical protein
MKRTREGTEIKAMDHLAAAHHAKGWVGQGGNVEEPAGTNHDRCSMGIRSRWLTQARNCNRCSVEAQPDRRLMVKSIMMIHTVHADGRIGRRNEQGGRADGIQVDEKRQKLRTFPSSRRLEDV